MRSRSSLSGETHARHYIIFNSQTGAVVSTYSSWTLIDVPTLGSILIYSQLVQTVFTSRLRRARLWLFRFAVPCREASPVQPASPLFQSD
jgi:hypothetical protein